MLFIMWWKWQKRRIPTVHWIFLSLLLSEVAPWSYQTGVQQQPQRISRESVSIVKDTFDTPDAMPENTSLTLAEKNRSSSAVLMRFQKCMHWGGAPRWVMCGAKTKKKNFWSHLWMIYFSPSHSKHCKRQSCSCRCNRRWCERLQDRSQQRSIQRNRPQAPNERRRGRSRWWDDRH